jgi:hypothetical protein
MAGEIDLVEEASEESFPASDLVKSMQAKS